MYPRRWRSLNELRDAYAASGLRLPVRLPQCRGKVRHATRADALAHLFTVGQQKDRQRADGMRVYTCRCGGFHVGHGNDGKGPRRRGRRQGRSH